MGSNISSDINNNHAQECQMDWGPRAVCGIKAITALGQLLLVRCLELDVSTLEISSSYDNRGRLPTAERKVHSCSKLYLEAFAKSEQSISKLSNTAWELASSRVSTSFIDYWISLGKRVQLLQSLLSDMYISDYTDTLTNLEQHTRATFESWTCLLSFIQEFESPINIMIKTRDKKDTRKFEFPYAIPLLIAVILVLLFSGLLVRAVIVYGMFLCALLILQEGLEQSGYQTTLDDDIEDETRDLKIESELLAQNTTTIGQTLQDVGSSLAAALGAIQETHDSYRAMFERISYTISMDEPYHRNSTTDQWQRESKDELRELVIVAPDVLHHL
ncbi:hypothetical protein FOYG_03835 [Fusarium oxysporum NRRL 32931]|uniref:Uncharacterized protein n=1 Tax=Fusarium oxysporum NRRL 32931 TaxID=660029 RepID=W9J546_FUSOX|nr:hypothetical protein FOYG_03835 [Fusarium oxysporum NRRL 32931]